MSEISATVRIGGKPIPIDNFESTGSSYGSVGHASFTTSGVALTAAGVDLYTLTSSSAGITEVIIDVKIDNHVTRIFGGEHLTTTWHLDNDAVQVHARSWAGVLVDQKRILTKIAQAITQVLAPLTPGQVNKKGISNENQKIGDIVTAIAEEFGFTPKLFLSNGNPMVGTLYGSGAQTFMPVPQSLWAILNTMARDTGYVIFDTPMKELVFGVPGSGSTPLEMFFGDVPKDGIPSRHVKLDHHPRRNSSFRVMVISYDPSNRQMAVGKANYIGRNFAGSSGLPAGLSVGTSATASNAVLAKLNVSSGVIALYTFHHDGLNQDQADALAASIATDIAKRELIMTATIDGDPDAAPTQIIRLRGKVPPEFTTTEFYTSGYTHSFRVPQGGHPGHSGVNGFNTTIKALNVPVEALAVENVG